MYFLGSSLRNFLLLVFLRLESMMNGVNDLNLFRSIFHSFKLDYTLLTCQAQKKLEPRNSFQRLDREAMGIHCHYTHPIGSLVLDKYNLTSGSQNNLKLSAAI